MHLSFTTRQLLTMWSGNANKCNIGGWIARSGGKQLLRGGGNMVGIFRFGASILDINRGIGRSYGGRSDLVHFLLGWWW